VPYDTFAKYVRYRSDTFDLAIFLGYFGVPDVDETLHIRLVAFAQRPYHLLL